MSKQLCLLLLTVIVVTSGCAGNITHIPSQETESTEASPEVRNEKLPSTLLVSRELIVNGLGLGSFRAEVEGMMGKPERVEKAPQQNLEFYQYRAKGLTVGISSDNRVHILAVEAPSNARTQNGIGIGSSMDDVKRVYGNPDVDGTYPLKSDQKNVFLMIEGKENKVTLLYASWGYK